MILMLLAGAAAAVNRLEVIDLPLGFAPEGITIGHPWEAYVGSIFGERNDAPLKYKQYPDNTWVLSRPPLLCSSLKARGPYRLSAHFLCYRAHQLVLAGKLLFFQRRVNTRRPVFG